MSVTDGKVPDRELKPNTVQGFHIQDGAITTEKIGDGAITTEKIFDATYTANFTANPVSNTSLSTAFTTLTSVLVDIPTWVGSVSITATVKVEMTNSSGVTQKLLVRILIAGSGEAPAQTSIRTGDTATLTESRTVDLVSPGSSVLVEVQVALDTGTNTTNQTRLGGSIIGER